MSTQCHAFKTRFAFVSLMFMFAFLFSLGFALPAYATTLYGKTVVSTVQDNVTPYLDSIAKVKDVEGLDVFVENGKTVVFSHADVDAKPFASLSDIEKGRFEELGKVRVGSVVYSRVSTTALSRGDESTDKLAERLNVGSHEVRSDGYLIDSEGLVVCTATSPWYNVGDTVDTPAGSGRVYDKAWGLKRVLCYYEQAN